MSATVLAATSQRRRDEIEAELGVAIDPEWFQAADLAGLRLRQLSEDPRLRPWLLRAMILRSERLMIGFIGFHGRPGMKYLDEWLPGAAEFGFTVFETYRGNGYATEAAKALIKWASTVKSVTAFVLTVAPDNVPSQAIAHGLGFSRLGAWDDPEGGPEEVLGLQV